MHLVEIFLPLNDNHGKPFPHESFTQVRETLIAQFNGLTTYSRAPADGLWKSSNDSTARDDSVIYEVMVPALDRDWWSLFRKNLETVFRQETVLIRASDILVL